MKRLIIFATALLCIGGIKAQENACVGLKNPNNFTMVGSHGEKWTGYTGTKNQQASTCSVSGSTFTTTVQASNLEGIIGSSTACEGQSSQNHQGIADYQRRFVIKGEGTDVLTGNQLHYTPPLDTSFHKSIRLGSSCGGTEAEQLTYEFNVNYENALVTIWYAMSLYNALHPTPGENPEFTIVVEKQRIVNGQPQTDASGEPLWELANGDTLCYLRPSPTQGAPLGEFTLGGSNNVYLPWNKVMVNLYHLYGQKVRIKITAGDCCWTQHYGYCYFAGECQPMKLRANGCAAGESDEVARINAPKGAVAYAWYRSKRGVLNSTSAQNDISNYELIPNATADSLNCLVEHFKRVPEGDTVTQNTFMCKMTTRMNLAQPYYVESKIVTNVGNTKPAIHIDSALDCTSGLKLVDLSSTPYAPDDTNQVDHNLTQWKFYTSSQPTDATFDTIMLGDTVYRAFANGGNHSVRVRVSAVDTTCWNEKTISIRTIKPPVPEIMIQRDSLCEGDTIVVFNRTTGAAYSEWTILGRVGDTVHQIAPSPQAARFPFDTTSTIILRTRNNVHYQQDTNIDGYLDDVYCYVKTTKRVQVQEYPELIVTGDTIVCLGTQAIVDVASQVDQTRYDWYTSPTGNPIQVNTPRLQLPAPEHDIRYYVKARSPFGCESWDSINIYIVDPKLKVPVTEMCEGETVRLYASNAYSYTWSSMPEDPSMSGQIHNDTLTVSPRQTTTYTLVGHGMNNCSASPLTQTVTVFIHPVPTVELSPKFIDSEEPSVTFRDASPGSTYTFWDFGNGNTSTQKQLRYTFTDLSEDSVLIKLVTGTGGELQCNSDTSFYLPIELFAVWLPNAFTPEESTNNIFSLYTNNLLEFFSFHLYDRHGSLILSTNDQNFTWDGTYKGTKCPQGVYVYTCTYRRPGTSDIVTQRGTVTLLR